MCADQRGDGLGFTRNRQLLVQSDGRLIQRARFPALHGRLQGLLERRRQPRIRRFGPPTREHPQQTTAVAAHGPVDRGLLLGQTCCMWFFDSAHQSIRLELLFTTERVV